MKMVVILAAGLSASALWQRLTQPTNSYAASERGLAQYSRQQYGEAARHFAAAAAKEPSALSSFNLGTAQIAAGQREQGSATLHRATIDPALRSAALYNRGNSALAGGAYEHAIRDYRASLRLRPDHAETKRNLEIALTRLDRMQQQRSGEGGGRAPQPQEQQQDQQPQPSSEEQSGDPDAEALLRSVQQQGQEELQRMKRARRGSGRIGW